MPTYQFLEDGQIVDTVQASSIEAACEMARASVSADLFNWDKPGVDEMTITLTVFGATEHVTLTETVTRPLALTEEVG